MAQGYSDSTGWHAAGTQLPGGAPVLNPISGQPYQMPQTVQTPPRPVQHPGQNALAGAGPAQFSPMGALPQGNWGQFSPMGGQSGYGIGSYGTMSGSAYGMGGGGMIQPMTQPQQPHPGYRPNRPHFAETQRGGSMYGGQPPVQNALAGFSGLGTRMSTMS